MNTLSNTFGISFFLKKRKDLKAQPAIYLRITVNQKRTEFSIKRTIDELNWNSVRGMAKGSKNEFTQLNSYLEKLRSRVVECYQELTLQKKVVTAELVKNTFLGTDLKEYTLIDLIEFHNQDMLSVLAPGTMKNYYTTAKYLRMLLAKEYRTNDKYLSELTYKFILDFERLLRNHQPLDHQKRLHTNGIMKHVERFRKMINLAVTMEWIEKDPFLKHKKKKDKVQREYLSKEELQRIEQKSFKIERLEQVKDLFLFSCYTGLSYIDVMNLKPSQIVKGNDGEYWLMTSRQKTSNMVKIPLLPMPVQLIEKYANDPKVVARKALLPNISNQKLNSYLKEIADVCDITKLLTYHIARHTFATTVTLTNGVPMESVSRMLGHTSLRTTQIYAKVIESKLGEDMAKLRSKLEKLTG
jgi:site-specific recombinase XerD